MQHDGACPGREAFLADARDVSDAAFRRIVTARARRLMGGRVAAPRSDGERRRLEQEIAAHFEKIHRGADFLPASFLTDGAERARAVGRVVTPTSLGTAFLVADGIVMTNNHVLQDAGEAGGSIVEFELEDGTVTAPVRPDLLFLTHEPLDYTIVAIDGSSLPAIEPVRLRRSPAGVTRHERVNIVQHPQGRPKEIAIHDNRVVRVQDRVIKYRTDTEPGSSGSPVFNNEWELVALHHAGVRDGDTAENEGIQVSAIVDHLLRGGVESAPRGDDRLGALLATIQDSSPFLGFFDSAGLRVDDPREVVVDGFTGNQQFADIGFWNIEHFNDRVGSGRVEDVADVVATLNMDALGLTEVQEGALGQLVDELGDRGMTAGFVVENVHGSQDIAVLFDRSTTTVERRGDLNRAHRSRLDARTSAGRTAFPRDPLFAHCVVEPDAENRVEFLMVVVHFKAFGDSQSRARRRLAARMLSEILAEVRASEGLPVVLGGDFNELLSNDVLSPLSDAPDMFALTADDATGTDPGAISYVGGSHRSLIDHIVVSSDVRMGEIQGDDAAIVRLDRSVADFADRVSDHVPVVFRMVMRDGPVDVEPPAGDEGPIELAIPAGADRLRVAFGDVERRAGNGRGEGARRKKATRRARARTGASRRSS